MTAVWIENPVRVAEWCCLLFEKNISVTNSVVPFFKTCSVTNLPPEMVTNDDFPPIVAGHTIDNCGPPLQGKMAKSTFIAR